MFQNWREPSRCLQQILHFQTFPQREFRNLQKRRRSRCVVVYMLENRNGFWLTAASGSM